MTDFGGYLSQGLVKTPTPGTARAAYTWAPQFTGLDVKDGAHFKALNAVALAGTRSATGGKSSFASQNYAGYVADKATPAFDWFEKFHVIQRSYTFGNVVSTQVAPIEVYNAFRRASHYWSAFSNGAGAGVTLLSQPTLPTLVPYQHGVQMTLQVSTSGPPRVDALLVFTFDTGQVINVPITLQRVVLFDVRPEAGYQEHLEWLTDISLKMNETEQRAAVRKNPRQFFDWDVLLADGNERDRVEALLFDWQASLFGIGMWHELTRNTTAISIGATTITVASTANADYRVNGLVLIYSDQTLYDVLQLSSFTGTTLTFSTGTVNAYPVGTSVMPLRTAMLPAEIQGNRYLINAGRLQAQFQVSDNDANLASVAAWPSFNSKVLLSGGNVVRGTMAESYDRRMVVLDPGPGLVEQGSPADRHRRRSVQTFRTGSQAELWQVRQLLHALRGRQVSFYLPTFAVDLELTDPLASGSALMNVKYVGYTQFIRQRQPKSLIRIVLTNGTTIIRTIIGSTIAIANVKETLTVDANWASNVTVASVLRIEYIEKVRQDSDRITIQYLPGDLSTRISAPVRTVLE